MENYLIFRKGASSNTIGSTGISEMPLNIIHAGDFESSYEAKTYIEEHLPSGEYIILKGEKFRNQVRT